MLEERLKTLENNIAELRKMKADVQAEAFKNNTRQQWALRYGLFESIQINGTRIKQIWPDFRGFLTADYLSALCNTLSVLRGKLERKGHEGQHEEDKG